MSNLSCRCCRILVFEATTAAVAVALRKGHSEPERISKHTTKVWVLSSTACTDWIPNAVSSHRFLCTDLSFCCQSPTHGNWLKLHIIFSELSKIHDICVDLVSKSQGPAVPWREPQPCQSPSHPDPAEGHKCSS